MDSFPKHKGASYILEGEQDPIPVQTEACCDSSFLEGEGRERGKSTGQPRTFHHSRWPPPSSATRRGRYSKKRYTSHKCLLYWEVGGVGYPCKVCKGRTGLGLLAIASSGLPAMDVCIGARHHLRFHTHPSQRIQPPTDY